MNRPLLTLLALFLSYATTSAQPLSIQSPVKFLALGDSYTIGQSVSVSQRWPVQLADSLATRGFTIDTTAIIATTGWRTDQLINAINTIQPAKDYNLVSLLIGVNNQYQNRPVSIYRQEFRQLLGMAIEQAGGDTSRVFVVSIPDYAFTPFGQGANPTAISAAIDNFNAVNQEITDSFQIKYYNITPISRNGLTDPALVAADGLHPSGKQYSEWVSLILEDIDQGLNATAVEPPSFLDEIKVWNTADGKEIRVFLPGELKGPIRFRIFNRWGAEVWKSERLQAGENRLFRPSNLARDIYLYYIQSQTDTIKTGQIMW